MKPKASWITAAIILAALLSVGWTLTEKQSPRAWEYKVVLFTFETEHAPFGSRDDAAQVLARQGAEGWEFVGQSGPFPPELSHAVLFYFKRQK